MRACWAAALFAAALLPKTVAADAGELTVGVGARGGYPRMAEAEAAARLGLADALAVQAELRAGYGNDTGAGAGLAALLLLDIFIWVPELRLAGGGRWQPASISAWGELGLGARWYLSMEKSLRLGLDAGLDTDGFYGRLGLAFWFDI